MNEEPPRDRDGNVAVRLAMVADVHLDTAFRWAPPEAGIRWRLQIRDTFRRASELAVAAGADAFLLGGDIYEHDLAAPDTGLFLAQVFAGLGSMPVLVAPGNHDFLCPSSLWQQTEWPSNVFIFPPSWERFSLSSRVDESTVTVWGIAHGQAAGTGRLLRDLRVEESGIHVGLFHGAAQGDASFGNESHAPHLPFDLDEVEDAGLDHVLCGHYHSWRHERLLTYPGNLHPLRFGEKPGRGMALIDVFRDGSISATRIEVPATGFHDLEVDLTGATTTDSVRERVAATLVDYSGALRVRLTGELGADLNLVAADLPGLTRSLDAVVWDDSGLHSGYDLEQIAAERTVRGEFVRAVLGRPELAEGTRRAVLLTGLRALDGRADLEVTL